MKSKEISVVFPCYNNELFIGSTIESVLDFSKKNLEYNFIFVNDGSTDKTLDIIREKTRGKRKFKVVSYDKNMGKGFAVRRGIESSEGDYICFTDSDLAYDLEHLKIFSKQLENCDLVIGNRSLANNEKKIKFMRVLAGKVHNLLSRVVLGLTYIDMQAGIKGYRKEVAKDLFRRQKINDYSFDVEVVYLAKKKRYRIEELPAKLSIEHQSIGSNINLAKDSINMFSNLFRIRLNDLFGRYG